MNKIRYSVLVLAALALAAGVAGGLLYTWILDPMDAPAASPQSLYIEDKLVYLALVGDLYAYEGDLEQAEARLTGLGIEAEGPVVADWVEQYLAGGGQPENVRNLARLAEDLGASGGVLLVFGPPPSPSPSPTAPPTAPLDPAVSPTTPPTATPAPTFRLIEQTPLCAEPDRPGKILVWVHDEQGNELAGIQVVVSWAVGQERFFTGLYPEIGPGYTDFEMSPRIEYEVTLSDFGADTAQGLASKVTAGDCPTDTTALDWKLIFQQTP